jgi:hypothetical protein
MSRTDNLSILRGSHKIGEVEREIDLFIPSSHGLPELRSFLQRRKVKLLPSIGLGIGRPIPALCMAGRAVRDGGAITSLWNHTGVEGWCLLLLCVWLRLLCFRFLSRGGNRLWSWDCISVELQTQFPATYVFPPFMANFGFGEISRRDFCDFSCIVTIRSIANRPKADAFVRVAARPHCRRIRLLMVHQTTSVADMRG